MIDYNTPLIDRNDGHIFSQRRGLRMVGKAEIPQRRFFSFLEVLRLQSQDILGISSEVKCQWVQRFVPEKHVKDNQFSKG